MPKIGFPFSGKIDTLVSPTLMLASYYTMPTYLFIDLETTGISPDKSRIIELSYIYDDADKSVTYETLVIPSYEITADVNEALKINGISLKDAKDKGKPIDQVIHELLPFMKKSDHIIAHNAIFDKNFLISEAQRLTDGNEIAKFIESKYKSGSFICTIQKARGLNLYKKKGDLKLGNLYNALFGHEIIGSHRALADTQACRKIFYKLLEKEKAKTSSTVVPIDKFYSSKNTRNKSKQSPHMSKTIGTVKEKTSNDNIEKKSPIQTETPKNYKRVYRSVKNGLVSKSYDYLPSTSTYEGDYDVDHGEDEDDYQYKRWLMINDPSKYEITYGCCEDSDSEFNRGWNPDTGVWSPPDEPDQIEEKQTTPIRVSHTESKTIPIAVTTIPIIVQQTESNKPKIQIKLGIQLPVSVPNSQYHVSEDSCSPDDTVMSFSKHKGKTYKNVLEHERGFCQWALNEEKKGDVSGKLQQFIDYIKSKQATKYV